MCVSLTHFSRDKFHFFFPTFLSQSAIKTVLIMVLYILLCMQVLHPWMVFICARIPNEHQYMLRPAYKGFEPEMH